MGKITGLAPADINYAYDNTSDKAGPAAIPSPWTAVAPFTTTLNSGAGDDAVNVQATSGDLSIQGFAGQDTVVIGSNAPATTWNACRDCRTGRRSQRPCRCTDLTIDFGDSTGHTATVTSGQLTGLAPALTYAGTTDLSSLNGGAGGDSVHGDAVEQFVPNFTVSINGDDPPRQAPAIRCR